MEMKSSRYDGVLRYSHWSSSEGTKTSMLADELGSKTEGGGP